MGEPWTVAAVMIVRNEARCIERALVSVLPLVDQIVVLDTGSTDDTIAIAKRCGAKVGTFTWVEDFAAARNAALDLADADWSFILDADEWVVDGGAALKTLRRRQPEAVGLVQIESTYKLDGQPVSSRTVLERVLPRGVRYRGRIHEQPHHQLSSFPAAVLLAHDGYEPVISEAKRGRNEGLLRLELVAHQGDPYLNYQLGKELQLREDFSGACAAYEIAYSRGSETVEWRHALIVRYLYVLKRAKDYGRAIQVMDAEVARWSESPDIYFTLGDLFLDMALDNPSQAAELMPLIESSWLESLRLGDRPDLPGSVRGRGSYLAAHNLGAFYASVGNPVKAAEYRGLCDQLKPL